jgi:hypothetical protein
VQRRQFIDHQRMLAGDWQFDIAVVDQGSAQDARLELKIAAPEPALDRDLPEARCAENQFVVGRLDQLA